MFHSVNTFSEDEIQKIHGIGMMQVCLVIVQLPMDNDGTERKGDHCLVLHPARPQHRAIFNRVQLLHWPHFHGPHPKGKNCLDNDKLNNSANHFVDTFYDAMSIRLNEHIHNT